MPRTIILDANAITQINKRAARLQSSIKQVHRVMKNNPAKTGVSGKGDVHVAAPSALVRNYLPPF